MREYPPEVYEHLVIVANAQENGWRADGCDRGPDFAMLREYCIGEGLTHDVPTGWITIDYEGPAPIKADGTVYYQITAKGRLILRQCENPGKKVKSIPKSRPGAKSTKSRDKQIADEYYDGLENGLWKSQVEYLQTKHKGKWTKNKNNAKSWFSTLLKRVASVKDLPSI